jgi:hypothetical protein
MAELSKQALRVENNTEFPNNNNGQITPSRLRGFNEDMIDSLVDEISYNADSASWNAQIAALDPSGSAGSISALNAFTASQLIVNSGLNASTASQQTQIDSLTAATASYATSAITASSLVTASFDNGTRNLTFTKGDASTFAVNIPDVSGSSGNFVTTSSFNAYTASNDQRVSSLEANSASVNTSISALNTFTQSADQRLDSIEAVSGSWITESETGSFATTGSNTFTGIQIFTSEITASNTLVNGDLTVFPNTSVKLNGNVDIQNYLYVGAGQTMGSPTAAITWLGSGSIDGTFSASVDARINAITGSGTTNTGSLLVTASAAGSTITFTKGDASTFSVSVDTGSAGTTIYEVVYTGENITKGDPLYISGSQGANPIVYKADASNPAKMPVTFVSAETIAAASTTEAIVLGLIEGIDLTGYTAGQEIYVAEGGGWSTSKPSGSASITQLLGVVTKGGNGGKGLVLNPGPATLPGLDNGYMWVGGANNQPTEITTASFATTGSNTFTGNQIITGSVYISSSAAVDLRVEGQIFVSSSATGGTTAPRITVSGSAGVTRINRNNITITDATDEGGMFPSTLYTKDAATFDEIGFTVDPSVFSISGWSTGPAIYVNNDALDTYPAVIGFQNKANYTDGRVAVLTPLSASAGFTASLQNGYAWVGNSLGQNTQVATSSFGSTIDTGSFATTGSNQFNGNQTVNGFVSASNGFFANDNTTTLTVGEGSNIRFVSGSSYYNVQLVPGVGDMAFSRDGVSNVKTFTLAGAAGNSTTFQNNSVEIQSSVPSFTVNAATQSYSGSGNIAFTSNNWTLSSLTSQFATTASFIGSVSVTGQSGGDGRAIMLGHSGSLVLANSSITNTYASLAHISSSAANANTNLIFKSNNNTADTIISSSANIFVNPSAPTSGFKRYLTGGNIAIGGSGAGFPQISGSMAWSPTIANNVFANSSTPITYRGPVSASASTINNNLFAGGTINLGQSATNNFERQQNALTMNGNILGGTLNAIAAKTPLSASSTIGNNVLVGSMTLNMDSSSVNANGNMINGGLTINNSYLPGTINSTSGFVGFNTSNVNGGLTAYFSGSNTSFTGTPRTISNILNAGGGNVISASFNGDNSSVNSLGLIGQGLLAYGNQTRAAAATDATWGGAFVGRWNAINGNRAYTADTVFAVGTGTAEASRKTAFLIDSGSNTFVEGTLNVSGSTSLTGSFRANIPTASAESQVNLFNWAPFVGANGTTYTSANFSLQDYASSNIDQQFVIEYANADFQKYTGFVVGPTTAGSKLQFSVNTGIGYDFDEISLTDNGNNTSTALIKSDTNILRGATQITGSLSVSSSISVQSGSYTGNVVTNITPVSSSLQPVLNIVTMTSAEYALITPDSQTLYVIV